MKTMSVVKVKLCVNILNKDNFLRQGKAVHQHPTRGRFPRQGSDLHLESLSRLERSEVVKIVRVHYFVRGGFAGNRSRASSKHLSPHLPVGELDSSGGQTGIALHLKLHVWASGLQRNRPNVDVFEK
ncbi:hypothetical protein TNCV_4658471 [Trichonephila clavipes]|nr:hypothetical protein TNCV_4658471 [Trichonephila clavipes]